ncbi:MAG: hypothetical protein JWQ76_744 [Ramlibacter sp.]|nr:hypothetical protein [Ramlibacter sp.]
MGTTKVAILGGGPAALSAAWEIVQSPGWAAGAYEIDVYTLGWRLGGKCASGRNVDQRWRNEEHGLHLLGGFYHNTFQQLRPLYAAWAQVSPHALRFEDAFKPHEGFTIASQVAGRWQPVIVNLPPMDGEPGVSPPPLDVHTLFSRMCDWIAGALGRVQLGLPLLDWTVVHPAGITPLIALGGVHAAAARQLQADFAQLAHTTRSPVAPLAQAVLTPNTQEAGTRLVAFANGLPVLQGADWRQVLKFLGATMLAMVADGVLVRGFDVVNDYEASQWLRERGGADDEAVSCPLFQAAYHYAFAYVDGQPQAKNIAAGAGMRGLLRMLFTYLGTVFQHMNGGMGEVVCVPYYEVLKARGVRFHFFHRVESLVPAGNTIGAIEFLVQADAKGGSSGYEPLVDAPVANGGVRRCWPTRPRESELNNPGPIRDIELESWWGSSGVGVKKTLHAGEHFDRCILAIPAGVLPFISGGLSAGHPPWAKMLGAIATTPTVSAQLWRHDDGNYGGLATEGLFTAYELPHSTWADISFQHVAETDRADQATISILCGPAPVAPPGTPHDGTFPAREQQRAADITEKWLRDHGATALPGASSNGAYDPALEYDRCVRLNSDPVSLYVVTPAGSVDSRLRCDQSGYSNLLLAGDWTRHNLDMGAVEAAVMSGRLCARALCGSPLEVYGERDVP